MHVHTQALSAPIFGDNSTTEEQEVLNTDSSSCNRMPRLKQGSCSHFKVSKNNNDFIKKNIPCKRILSIFPKTAKKNHLLASQWVSKFPASESCL